MRDPMTKTLKRHLTVAPTHVPTLNVDGPRKEPPSRAFIGVPPADVLEALFANVLTNTQAALDVAHEGTSNLTPEAAVRVACVIAVCEANPIILNLLGVSRASLRHKHRDMLDVWKRAVPRMTAAVKAYEEDPTGHNAVVMAHSVVDFTQVSHLVLSEETSKADRKEAIADFKQRRALPTEVN